MVLAVRNWYLSPTGPYIDGISSPPDALKGRELPFSHVRPLTTQIGPCTPAPQTCTHCERISSAPHFDSSLDRLCWHVLFEAGAALKTYHGLIDGVFTARLVQSGQLLLQLHQYWADFLQAIMARLTMQRKVAVVRKVQVPTDLSETVPSDSICDGAVVEKLITSPVVINGRQ